MTKAKISVLIPCYNEQENILILKNKIIEQFKRSNYEYELIFIDNNSQDNTADLIRNLARDDKKIKFIRFSRNFGPTVEASILAGLSKCSGEAAIIIYSDLQDPPELIPQFIQAWEQGFDIVNAIQSKRIGEPMWRKILVKIFYKFLTILSDSPVKQNAGDFKLISRKVIDVLIALPEKNRFNRGLITWTGFLTKDITYDRLARPSGKSKANFFAITMTAISGITSFSLKPLRLMTFFGFLVLLASILTSSVYIIQAIVGNPIPGLSTITILLLLNIGLTTSGLGLLGEYIGRIQIEVKQRPLYIISETINLK